MAITLKSTKGLHAHGVKCLVYGHAGAGKTSLIPTLPAPIVLSAEGGLLSIADAEVPFIEIGSMADLMEAYQWLTESADAKGFQSVALDSISEIAEVVLAEGVVQRITRRLAYLLAHRQTSRLQGCRANRRKAWRKSGSVIWQEKILNKLNQHKDKIMKQGNMNQKCMCWT